jgi:hypothetical protein
LQFKIVSGESQRRLGLLSFDIDSMERLSILQDDNQE